VGWRAGNYSRYETAMRQISACTGPGRRSGSVKIVKMKELEGTATGRWYGSYTRRWQSSAAPEASPPCLKW